MKKDVLKLIKKTTSVMLAGVMAGGGATSTVAAAGVTTQTKKFDSGAVGSALKSIGDILTGNEEKDVEYKSHKTTSSFSSHRLVIKASKGSIIKKEDRSKIIGKSGNYYLMKFDSDAEAEMAYKKYLATNKVVVSPDVSVHMASEENKNAETGGLKNVTSDSNPIDSLKDESGKITKSEISQAKKDNVIAVIDTGSNDSSNVIDSISLVDNDPSDKAGHGSNIIRQITENNPDAKIISIKALNDQGEGNASSVAAAIKYAVERKVSVINLSLSGLASDGNSIVSSAIEEAVSKGIKVVGAAGNNDRDAKYYIPGSCGSAIIVGSCDKNGKKNKSSNYGNTIDYYVNAPSTSYAAAIMSAYLSKNMKDDGTYTISTNKGTFFIPDFHLSDETRQKTDQVGSLKEDTSKYVLIRYLLADVNKLTSDDTISTVVRHNKDITMVSDTVHPYKAKDGTYKIIANAPYYNGLRMNGPKSVDFANANDNGEVIKKGISFDFDTGIATVKDDSVFKRDDYGDLQMELLVPTKLGVPATITGCIEDEKGKVIDQHVSETTPYLPFGFKLYMTRRDGSPLKKSDIEVYEENSKNPISPEDFSFDESTSTVGFRQYAGAVSKMTIKVKNGKADEKFRSAYSITLSNGGSGTIPGYYLNTSADKDSSWTDMKTGYYTYTMGFSHAGKNLRGGNKTRGPYVGGVVPNSYISILGRGRTSFIPQSPYLNKISLPKTLGNYDIEGGSMKKRDDKKWDLRLYKNANNKSYVGDNPGDSNYSNWFQAYCFHIKRKAAQTYDDPAHLSTKGAKTRIVMMCLDSSDESKNYIKDSSIPKGYHIRIMGFRQSGDEKSGNCYCDTSTPGWYQYQGAIIAVAFKKTDDKPVSASVKKTWEPGMTKKSVTFGLYYNKNGKKNYYAIPGNEKAEHPSQVTLPIKKGDKEIWKYTTPKKLPKKIGGKNVSWKFNELGSTYIEKYKYSGNYTYCKNIMKPTPTQRPVDKKFKGFDKNDDGDPLVENKEIEINAHASGTDYRLTGEKDKDGNPIEETITINEDHTLNSDNGWRYVKGLYNSKGTVDWTETGWRFKGETAWKSMDTLPNNVVTKTIDGQETHFVNTQTKTVTATIRKEWESNDADDITAPVDRVVAKLYRSCEADNDADEDTGITATLETNNGWTATVPNLQEYKDNNDDDDDYKWTYYWREDPSNPTSATIYNRSENFSGIVSWAGTDDYEDDDDGQNYTTDVTNRSAPQIGTVAVDGSTNIKAGVSTVQKGNSIKDKVQLTNVSPKVSYTLVASIGLIGQSSMSEEGTAITEILGSASSTFTPQVTVNGTSTSGSTDITIPFSDDKVGTDLAGKTIVVVETLYDAGTGAQLAEEYTVDSRAQQVHFPKIRTHMVSEDVNSKYAPLLNGNNDGSYFSNGDADFKTGDSDSAHFSKLPSNLKDGTVTMKDTVTYENLAKGHTYTVTGVLHRRGRTYQKGEDLGAVKDDSGNPITASATFTVPGDDSSDSPTASGTVDVVYQFKVPERLYGGDYVSFETLKYNGIDLTAHADIKDNQQTVRMSTAIRVIKKSPDDEKPLKGVQLKLFTMENNKLTAYKKDDGNEYVVTTDNNGVAMFLNLDIGTYYVREISSVASKDDQTYVASLQKDDFSMKSKEGKSQSGSIESGVEQRILYDNDVVQLTTGGSGVYKFYYIAAAATLAAVAMYIIRKKKKTE